MPIQFTCRQCGNAFTRKPSYVRANGKNLHCSRGCAYASRVVLPSVRLWRYVDKSGPVPAHCPELGSCWLWTGTKDSYGYGYFQVAPRTPRKASRVSWELANGPIEGGLWVLHKCDNPPCVRPDHLFLGTAQDNTDDMIRKGRRRSGGPLVPLRGRKNGMARLTSEQVLEIRSLYAERAATQEALAARYGIDQTTVSSVVRRKNWRHI